VGATITVADVFIWLRTGPDQQGPNPKIESAV
jgi:hypothetical protein